jgi:Domain of unknown function (DUF4032)
VRLQLTSPSEHQAIVGLPWAARLEAWPIDGLRDPGGMHRHVVRFLEVGDVTYVLKELPDHLVAREYRLLRLLADGEGILITRHLDFSLPYRVLLSGRGMKIPYLGERLLDALVGLLVRLHVEGFYWGDCSLYNTLFRRDAGALVAFVIDVETGELHDTLSSGQRLADLQIAVENVAGGLYDLQLAGQLAEGIDPFETAEAVEVRYHQLWDEVTAEEVFAPDETFRVDKRLRRLHDLGFDVGEIELISDESGDRIRLVPRVVEFGFHGPRLASLTGLKTGENQARRLLQDIRLYGAELEKRTGNRIPENVVAARWLDRVYEPTLATIPDELRYRLESPELYHQLLEHRWYLSERAGKDVGLSTAIGSYIEDVLRIAPDEHTIIDPATMEMPALNINDDDPN